MRKEVVMAIVLLALGAAGTSPAAHAQGKTEEKATFAAVFDHSLTGVEKEFVSAAEAMPDDKFNFAPTQGEFKGVRTFAEEVKHVAEANYYFYAGPDYSEAADKANSASIDKLTSKADIVKALMDSFVRAHAFIDTITPENAFVLTPHGTRAGMAAFGIAHFMDHYGQMVEYLRMNGIVPPASRNPS
jgi:hypothetical protein